MFFKRLLSGVLVKILAPPLFIKNRKALPLAKEGFIVGRFPSLVPMPLPQLKPALGRWISVLVAALTKRHRRYVSRQQTVSSQFCRGLGLTVLTAKLVLLRL